MEFGQTTATVIFTQFVLPVDVLMGEVRRKQEGPQTGAVTKCALDPGFPLQ